MPENTRPEKARLFAVEGPNDTSENKTGIPVQFNPTSLKVALSNKLDANERNGSSSSAQYIDSSSSTLAVELIFDTSDTFYSEERPTEGGETESVDTREDVRDRTRVIAENFLQPVEEGNRLKAPKRCLFQWGSFEFVGLVESFDETLDFFSPEGTPMRATVALKLKEDRFQFRSRETQAAQQETPAITPTEGSAAPDRDSSLYNGVENPRQPGVPALAKPNLSPSAALSASASIKASASIGVSASIGASVGVSGGVSAGFGASAGAGFSAGAGLSAGAGVSAAAGLSAGGGLSVSASAKLTPPAFSYGASASLGTGIPGAFSTDTKSVGGLTAGSLVTGGAALRAGTSAGATLSAGAEAQASASVGFD